MGAASRRFFMTTETNGSLDDEASSILVLINRLFLIESDDPIDETAKHEALGYLHLAYAALNRRWEPIR